MKFIYILLAVLVLFSCKDEESEVLLNTECYSFDIRQCQTDGFADEISETASVSDRESLMLTWLTEQGFAVVDVKLVIAFHEAVCEACAICPQGDRYYMHTNIQDNNTSLGETLNLLSFEEDDCSIFN